MKKLVLLGLLSVLLSCVSTTVFDKAESYALQNEWLKAVIEYRKAYAKNPADIELRSRLAQTELKAADYYYQDGLRLIELGNLDGAIVKFQQGLVAKSTHVKLSQAMNNLLARKDADNLYNDAVLHENAGKYRQANTLYEKALAIYPGHDRARKALMKAQASEEDKQSQDLALKSEAPITLNFRDTELKTAFDFIAKSFGINVIFDDAVKDTTITLFAKNVTFKQALDLVLTTTKTFYRQVGVNTIIIAPDTIDKHSQYEDHIIRVFHLKTVGAKEMSNILKGVLTVKKLIINDELNSIIIRDTAQVLALVEKIINVNDRTPAEMILDVDILEVNRTKAEQLGLDFGTEISSTFPQFPISGSLTDTLRAGTVTLPAITFRYFKQDVDAKTLANPKIRVMNNKIAKIHIGDRVPLRAATITDSLGQSRTSFEYKDIGIRLTVEPNIHLDNSATVKMSLEVSTLGQNLGTPEEPAFSIGTRNADTYMLLRDGETAILGGLIRDEDRNARISVPGLGDIPAVGLLFSSSDTSDSRTDVLLTITPRIVRAWDLPTQEERQIYSGTENNISNEPVFDYVTAAARTKDYSSSISTDHNDTLGLPKTGRALSDMGNDQDLDDVSMSNAILSFSQSHYNANEGNTFNIVLTGEQLSLIKNLPIELLFNPQLMQFDKIESNLSSAASFTVDNDDATNGVLRFQIKDLTEIDNSDLVTLQFSALNSGISYLIYRNSHYTDAIGETKRPRVNSSRVIIK